MPAFGFIEAPFLSVAAVLADHAANSAFVRITGFETCGNENILVRLRGLNDDVQSAIASAARKAKELGSSVITTCMAAPATGLSALVNFPTPKIPSTAVATSFFPLTHLLHFERRRKVKILY